MAAYAAAVSLMHIIDLIENHPSPPISFDKQQLHRLIAVVTFLQEFLEGYVSPYSYSDEADPLEMRIAEAVYAAEDVIESYVVYSIQLAATAAAASSRHGEDDVDRIQKAAAAREKYSPCLMRECFTFLQVFLEGIISPFRNKGKDEDIRYIYFYQGLQKVIEAMDVIKKEAVEMDREKGGLEIELLRNISVNARSESSSTESKIEMVGFEDELLQLKERLVGGDPNRQIIPIVGMGGMGKTTLARNVFSDKLIQEHFDICLWATISQDHNLEQTLSEVLSQVKLNSGVAGLGEELYKHLFNRRYLVVLDDLWSIEVWDKMRSFFPDCGEGSRIIVTTRISNLAAHLTNSSNSVCMSFLNEPDSWTLFSKSVFGSEGSNVPELREIGEKIVGKCKGLPLSIIVIGGLLAKSERTQGYWEYVEKNLSSIVNLENEEYCLRVLKLSYNHLPAYLKPCFLYMGVFDEDSEIEVSTIINLWVSEGFVKPRKKKKQNLERVAREYLQELVDRNLLLSHESKSSMDWAGVRELGLVGNNMKLCKMHDLVRDVCLREAQKQSFYYICSKEHNHHPSSHRHIVIPKQHGGIEGPEIMLESSPNPRSYVCNDHRVGQFPNFRLLRTLHTIYRGTYSSFHPYEQKDVFRLVNVRLLAISLSPDLENSMLRSSISRLWSLHTLIVHSWHELEGPVEFWKMHQLKHVEFTKGRLRLHLPPPLNNDNNMIVLENLQTLMGMVDFHLNEDVVRRIPNLRIFCVKYGKKRNLKVHCLSYLQRLSKLESFRCSIQEESGENMQRTCFPQSLNQILLIDDASYPQIELEGLLQKIGRLPSVEELLVRNVFFRSRNWETIQGQFPRLKTLELIKCGDLKKWTVSEASHFPLLHKLILMKLKELEEIPSEIGEITTLESIEVHYCSRSAVLSAKKIVEEQEELYGDEQLSFRVLVVDANRAYRVMATPNFQVGL